MRNIFLVYSVTGVAARWAFCDTDSMAIAKPAGMDHETFVKECLKVASWFDPLNPYEAKRPLFKVEDANYGIGSKDIAPLYCYSSGSPALRRPSNALGRFGECAIAHFTVRLGLRRRAGHGS